MWNVFRSIIKKNYAFSDRSLTGMIKKAIKLTLWIILSVILLIVLALLLLHTDKGKSFVKNRIQIFLRDHYSIPVAIGGIDYRLPQWIELDNVIIRDKNSDTLVSGKSLRIDIAMLELLRNDVQ